MTTFLDQKNPFSCHNYFDLGLKIMRSRVEAVWKEWGTADFLFFEFIVWVVKQMTKISDCAAFWYLQWLNFLSFWVSEYRICLVITDPVGLSSCCSPLLFAGANYFSLCYLTTVRPLVLASLVLLFSMLQHLSLVNTNSNCSAFDQEEELKGAVVLIFANKQVQLILLFVFAFYLPF